MTIGLKGLYTPPAPEDRDIVYLEVVHNGQTYDWMAFISKSKSLGESLSDIEPKIYAEIDYKEAVWAALDPKTKTIIDPITGQETVVDMQKEEIVKPDNPDYYALRRGEYPALGDQLDSYWKGPDFPEYAEMAQKIAEVKAKYPKPPYI